MFTQGVAALGQEAQRQIIEALRRYDDFDADNDPYGEHDFGMIVAQGHELLFKIDSTTATSFTTLPMRLTHRSQPAC